MSSAPVASAPGPAGAGGPGGQRGGFGGGMSGAPRPRTQRPVRRNQEEKAQWIPVTNLGRLVKAGVIKSMAEIFSHSIPIKEHQIVDKFFSKAVVPGQAPDPMEENSGKPLLADKVMGITPVQKQSASGQSTRFKAFVIVGDSRSHIGCGTKCAKEVATAIRGAIIAAKLSIAPVRRGWWGNIIGAKHTVPMKVSGKCGSVRARLIPAPRGTGVVGSPIAKELLAFAGVSDCFTGSTGHTRTKENFLKAYYYALRKTYAMCTPDLWKNTLTPSPFDLHPKLLEDKEIANKEANATATAAA